MCIFAAGMTVMGATLTAETALMANISMVSTAFQMYGSYQQGKAQQAQYDYQAQVNENNRKIAEWQAQDAIKRGDIEEKRHRLKVEQLKGRQRSVLAASNVEIDSGSALDTLGDTAELGELDALTIRSNAEREAYDYRVSAMNQGAEAGANRLAGRNARTAGNYGAMTSLLTGANSMADKWYKWST